MKFSFFIAVVAVVETGWKSTSEFVASFWGIFESAGIQHRYVDFGVVAERWRNLWKFGFAVVDW